MTDKSVNELAWAINQKNLEESLIKAEALLKMGMSSDLHNNSALVLHGYLWTLCDLISTARRLI